MEDIRPYREEQEKRQFRDEDHRERDRDWSARDSSDEEVPFEIPRD